jgi:hypothetical protein
MTEHYRAQVQQPPFAVVAPGDVVWVPVFASRSATRCRSGALQAHPSPPGEKATLAQVGRSSLTPVPHGGPVAPGLARHHRG